MEGILEKSVVEANPPGLTRRALDRSSPKASPASHRVPQGVACFHCGEPCPDHGFTRQEKSFCCQGCLFVHDLLANSGLEQFYDLSTHPGVRVRKSPPGGHWDYLDEPNLQARLLDFTDGNVSRVTLHIPGIHCVACVWLLENLFRLLPGLGASRVNFPRREVSLSFPTGRVRLSQIVALLVSIGYEPELNFGQLDKAKPGPHGKRLWLQIGVAGFAFGNIMLFSLPAYLGLDSFSGPAFQDLFGYLGLVLAAPVLLFSASDYWRSAWLSTRQRMLTLEVPIALGLAALYAQSAFEIVSGRGRGYADSLAGLVFFLLCGRAFQQQTHERIAFDRDYKSFFPLSVTRRRGTGEERVSLAELQVGDRLVVRNGELIPADATLLSAEACIDYSFVTGESEPVTRRAGDRLYAGGQQAGSSIELQTLKAVSQSYLTALWNHEAFQKANRNDLHTLTNRYSRRFTWIVMTLAAAAAFFWSVSGDPARGLKAFTSVLIVACPCALALAAPFALGTAQRVLGRLQVFLKNTLVLERLAEVDTIVFDKTGTLTTPRANGVRFLSATAASGRQGRRSPAPAGDGFSGALSSVEQLWLRTAVAQSNHPHARRLAETLTAPGSDGPATIMAPAFFKEIPGCGLQARVEGHELHLGSRAWLEEISGPLPCSDGPPGSLSYLSIDGRFRGAFVLGNGLRPRTDRLLSNLGASYDLALLSGDNEKQRAQFQQLFGPQARLHFYQSPLDKLGFIRNLQGSGKTVMMVGDGLNDAGALKQSDVGVAVVEKAGVFSPASDIILEADQVPELGRLLKFARTCTKVVRCSFVISALYNLVGISIAASGILSPLICAILMPLSSLSVVLFACGMTTWAAKRAGFTQTCQKLNAWTPQIQGDHR